MMDLTAASLLPQCRAASATTSREIRVMSTAKTDLASEIEDLVLANHILHAEGVVDSFGHVSFRSPERPDRFFMARAMLRQGVVGQTTGRSRNATHRLRVMAMRVASFAARGAAPHR